MSLLSPSGSSSRHEPLPSLPPSPTEEDLGGASLWQVAEEEEAQNHERLVTGSVKGKERAREISLDEGESDGTFNLAFDGAYPSHKDEEEESRKVEENLKRLEQTERQRRKAARDSAASVAPGSVVNGVSRRASHFWPGRLRSGSAGSRTAAHNVHTQLGQSSEDALPLSDLHGGSNLLISPTGSKPPSPTSHDTSVLPIPTIVENPFEPPDSATPLRGFPDDENGDMSSSAVMRPSSPPPPTPVGTHAPDDSPFDDHAEKRATLQASSSFSRAPRSQLQPSQLHHPLDPLPPLPLDLPPPKTPPPRTGISDAAPTISSPPSRVPAPSSSTPRPNTVTINQDGQEQENRWWTDWLCGCREEKDRVNAGRTNPFE